MSPDSKGLTLTPFCNTWFSANTGGTKWSKFPHDWGVSKVTGTTGWSPWWLPLLLLPKFFSQKWSYLDTVKPEYKSYCQVQRLYCNMDYSKDFGPTVIYIIFTGVHFSWSCTSTCSCWKKPLIDGKYPYPLSPNIPRGPARWYCPKVTWLNWGEPQTPAKMCYFLTSIILHIRPRV